MSEMEPYTEREANDFLVGGSGRMLASLWKSAAEKSLPKGRFYIDNHAIRLASLIEWIIPNLSLNADVPNEVVSQSCRTFRSIDANMIHAVCFLVELTLDLRKRMDEEKCGKPL